MLPSLDVSFHVSPCPSKLRQFLVRMDLINRTSSEVFQLHQLSTVGNQWEISVLQPIDALTPSRHIVNGQELSCFFMLKVNAAGCIIRMENFVLLKFSLRYCWWDLLVDLKCYFSYIQDRRKSNPDEDQSSPSPCFGRDVKLGSGDANEPVYDTSSSPLADFHHYERLHQTSHQVRNL